MLMSAAFGMALAVQDNVVSNYFGDVLGLEGPQFGYITAIREVPGFLLIFLTALFYKMSIPRLTAMMLLVLAAGLMLFTFSNSFWSVAPWVIISSMGYHTVLQTQYALGLSLTTQDRAGSVLGRLTAVHNAGALAAMGAVFLIFTVIPDAFRLTFVLSGLIAVVAAVAIFRMPNLDDGVEQKVVPERPKLVLRRPYRLYYYLHLLDGARMQIFFSFGLYVLVVIYGMSVREITLLLVATKLVAMVTGPWIGNMIDLHGEKATPRLAEHHLYRRSRGVCTDRQRLRRFGDLPRLLGDLPAVVGRFGYLPPKGGGTRRDRPDACDGSDAESRRGDRRAGHDRIHPQLRRL